MLMDILMEALMNMDDETLDSVLESCDAEELEIISDAMEARFEDGPTVVKDKGAMRNRVIDNIDSNITDRTHSSVDHPVMTAVAANSKASDPAHPYHTMSTKYLGNQNAKKIQEYDKKYKNLDRFDKASKKKDYEEGRKSMIKSFKDNYHTGENSNTVRSGVYINRAKNNDDFFKRLATIKSSKAHDTYIALKKRKYDK